MDSRLLQRRYRHTYEGAGEELLRGCWAVALFVELVRGVQFERSALGLLGDRPTYSDILGVMPASAIDDLRCLERAFVDVLLPMIRSRRGNLCTGPAFSTVLPGDADLIKGTTLIEMKAMVHRRKRDGTPRYGLDSRLIYQILAYALLAQERFAINEVVVFDARYAHVYSWPLDLLLTELAGADVRAHKLAARLRMFLEDPLDARVPPAARRAALAVVERAAIRHS